MAAVFADTGYWIAMLLPGDWLHHRAMAMAAIYDEATVVTTQMVLTEVLNHVSKMGPNTRLAAARLLEYLGSDPNVEIVPQTDSQFRTTVERYTSRSDQRWGLTDCASFLVVEEHGITEPLAMTEISSGPGSSPFCGKGDRIPSMNILHDRPRPAHLSFGKPENPGCLRDPLNPQLNLTLFKTRCYSQMWPRALNLHPTERYSSCQLT